MKDYIEIQDHYDRGTAQASSGFLTGASLLSGVMTRVYIWMTAALCITATAAYFTATSPALLSLIFGNSVAIRMPSEGWIGDGRLLVFLWCRDPLRKSLRAE